MSVRGINQWAESRDNDPLQNEQLFNRLSVSRRGQKLQIKQGSSPTTTSHVPQVLSVERTCIPSPNHLSLTTAQVQVKLQKDRKILGK